MCVCAASLALPLLRKEEGSGDTLIREPVTEECNGVGSCVFMLDDRECDF